MRHGRRHLSLILERCPPLGWMCVSCGNGGEKRLMYARAVSSVGLIIFAAVLSRNQTYLWPVIGARNLYTPINCQPSSSNTGRYRTGDITGVAATVLMTGNVSNLQGIPPEHDLPRFNAAVARHIPSSLAAMVRTKPKSPHLLRVPLLLAAFPVSGSRGLLCRGPS